MSADLLRLAAATLRVHVNEVMTNDNLSQSINEHSWENVANDALGGPMGEFCALMSPKVVTEMANLLQVMSHLPDQSNKIDLHAATKVARAILREEEPQPAGSKGLNALKEKAERHWSDTCMIPDCGCSGKAHA